MDKNFENKDLKNTVDTSPNIKGPRKKNPLFAAILSIIPGLGQIYNGNLLLGLLFGIIGFMSLFLTITQLNYNVFPFFLLVLIICVVFSMVYAFITARKMNKGSIDIKNGKILSYLVYFIASVIIGLIIWNILLIPVLSSGITYGSSCGTPSVDMNNGELRSYPYVLNGQKGEIKTHLYKEVYNYSICRGQFSGTSYFSGNIFYNVIIPSWVEDPVQKKYIQDLVYQIKTKSSDKDDQVRIAISLVQNIPINQQAYQNVRPYLILYENQGICDKSLLLAVILKELDYNYVIFWWDDIRHIAVGVKVPDKFSNFKSGYAYVESTIPSIPTVTLKDSNGVDLDFENLAYPKIIYSSKGNLTFASIEEEYNDAQVYQSLVKKSRKQGNALYGSDSTTYLNLCKKYGMPME